MAVKPGLRVRQTQRLALTPGLRQSLAVLQMSATEIEALVQAEIEENPLLAIGETGFETARRSYDFALGTVAQQTGLFQHLIAQIGLIKAPADSRAIATHLAGNLTEQGYVADSDAAIAAELGTSETQVARAIDLLQTCEPVGIGARNLRECLNLQLVAAGVIESDRQFLLDNLPDMARARLSDLKRLKPLAGRTVSELLAILKTLTGNPADKFTAATAAVVVPDVLVSADEKGRLTVELTHSTLPTLAITAPELDSPRRQDAATLDYLRAQRLRAQSLLTAIEARSKTLLLVAHKLVSRQAAFFTEGPGALVPLTQKALAQDMNLHPATITRAVANKALSCRFGVYPLRYFFSSGLKSSGANKGISARAVQHQIRRLINAESPGNILSDDAITTHLRESGVDISRRTVAKYRECLKISSSVQRRRSKRIL